MDISSPKDSDRFAFGKNWARYQSNLDEERIQAAIASLQTLLGQSEFSGCRFLDAGSGSGLFSLAAYRLGAQVTSFDADRDAVSCTERLQQAAHLPGRSWDVHHGSLLDEAFLSELGTFDIVYCWGVAHHTGDMWRAIELLTRRVEDEGRLVLAIYNDELYVSRIWRCVKQLYSRLPRWLRPAYVLGIGGFLFLKRFLATMLATCFRVIGMKSPFVPWQHWWRETQSRGMHGWYDLVDWVGGWPYEVARPEAIFRCLRDRSFILEELTTSTGHGCNEFVFRKVSPSN